MLTAAAAAGGTLSACLVLAWDLPAAAGTCLVPAGPAADDAFDGFPDPAGATVARGR